MLGDGGTHTCVLSRVSGGTLQVAQGSVAPGARNLSVLLGLQKGAEGPWSPRQVW